MIRVACIGSHGTGKTTLMDLLQKDLEGRNYRVLRVGSITREIRELGVPINQDGDLIMQVLSFALQYVELLKALKQENNYHYLLSDRSVYDDIAYLSCSVDIPLQQKYFLETVINQSMSNFWTHVFYTPIKTVMENDGVRSDELEYQREVDIHIRSIFRNLEQSSSGTRLATLDEVGFEQELRKMLVCLGF